MKRADYTPKMGKEVILQAATLSNPEVRFLVSNYYDAQDARKRADMQLRHLGDTEVQELPGVLQYAAEVNAALEADVRKALKKFAEASAVGRWMMEQYGVAEVLTAGFLAHLDIEHAPTVGHFWSFAGLNPAMKWEKGEKRPYNAAVKQLCYHLGECFKRSSNSPQSIYGAIYRARKALLVERNENGFNAERAKTFRTTSAEVRKKLAEGKLPDGNLDRQACNYAAKIFLSHLHAVMYWDHHKKPPPKPFAIQHQGHAHEIKVPSLDMFPGLEAAYYGTKRKRAA
jgi:hypothetical protein